MLLNIIFTRVLTLCKRFGRKVDPQPNKCTKDDVADSPLAMLVAPAAASETGVLRFDILSNLILKVIRVFFILPCTYHIAFISQNWGGGVLEVLVADTLYSFYLKSIRFSV